MLLWKSHRYKSWFTNKDFSKGGQRCFEKDVLLLLQKDSMLLKRWAVFRWSNGCHSVYMEKWHFFLYLFFSIKNVPDEIWGCPNVPQGCCIVEPVSSCRSRKWRITWFDTEFRIDVDKKPQKQRRNCVVTNCNYNCPRVKHGDAANEENKTRRDSATA